MTFWMEMIQKLLQPHRNGGSVAQCDEFGLCTGARNYALFVRLPVDGTARLLSVADDDASVRLAVRMYTIGCVRVACQTILIRRRTNGESNVSDTVEVFYHVTWS